MTKLSFDQQKVTIESYLDLEDKHYGMLLLFAMHVRIGPTLQTDFCPYMNFIGNKESGKTNSTIFVTEMCRGAFIPKCTSAYLLRKMGKLANSGQCIGLDQLDDHLENMEDLYGLLEIGNKWSASYGVMEKDKKGKQVETEVNCGGPKIMNSLIPPMKGTLRSRCYEVFTYPTPLAVQCSTMFPFRKAHMDSLADSLDAWATDYKAKVKLIDVENFIKSDEHQSDLEFLKKYGARRLDTANVFCTLNHFLGWGVDVVGALSYDQGDTEVDEFRDILRDVTKLNNWTGTQVRARELCTAVNLKYREANWPPLTETRFGILMARAGFGTYDDSKVQRRHVCFYDLSPMKLDIPVQSTIWGTKGLKP